MLGLINREVRLVSLAAQTVGMRGGALMASAVSVALLGRHTILRETLRQVLADAGFHAPHSAATIDAIGAWGEDGVDIILILADKWSGEMVAPLGLRFPGARIVLLADAFDFHELRAAFQAGVAGYLIRQIPTERLIGSLRLVALGEKVFPSQLAAELVEQTTPDQQDAIASLVDSARLSCRELEVLRCLMMGLSNKIVSRRLSISEATVKVHVKAVMRKLNVINRTQAAIWANSHGLKELEWDEARLAQAPPSSPRAAPAMPLLPGLLEMPRMIDRSV